MTFKPGQSGNPSGRPKKLLKRVDEVLAERGIEPIAEVLRLLDALKKKRPPIKPAPASLTRAEKRVWQTAERARKKAELDDQQLKIWLEILPYVYTRPREMPADDQPADESGKRRLAGLTDDQLLQLVKANAG